MNILPYLFLLLLCLTVKGEDIVDDRLNDDPDALTQKALPIYPIRQGEVVIAAGLTFDRVPWTHGIFDPNKQAPVITVKADGKAAIDLQPTPFGYYVTDDVMIVCWDKDHKDMSGEPKLQGYRCISYRFKDTTAHLQSITVLTYNAVPFCICLGNMPTDAPALWSDARLQMLDNKVEIDVGQVESGTGAFNSHAYFSVDPSGPMLTRITSGGRGR